MVAEHRSSQLFSFAAAQITVPKLRVQAKGETRRSNNTVMGTCASLCSANPTRVLHFCQAALPLSYIGAAVGDKVFRRLTSFLLQTVGRGIRNRSVLTPFQKYNGTPAAFVLCTTIALSVVTPRRCRPCCLFCVGMRRKRLLQTDTLRSTATSSLDDCTNNRAEIPGRSRGRGITVTVACCPLRGWTRRVRCRFSCEYRLRRPSACALPTLSSNTSLCGWTLSGNFCHVVICK